MSWIIFTDILKSKITLDSNVCAVPVLYSSLTLKGPGFFVYLKSGGGGAEISAAERRKILKFGTYVEFINTHVLTKLQC